MLAYVDFAEPGDSGIGLGFGLEGERLFQFLSFQEPKGDRKLPEFHFFFFFVDRRHIE